LKNIKFRKGRNCSESLAERAGNVGCGSLFNFNLKTEIPNVHRG
jgi:hypothetical protein